MEETRTDNIEKHDFKKWNESILEPLLEILDYQCCDTKSDSESSLLGSSPWGK